MERWLVKLPWEGQMGQEKREWARVEPWRMVGHISLRSRGIEG